MPLRRAHNDVAEHEGKKAQTGVGWGMPECLVVLTEVVCACPQRQHGGSIKAWLVGVGFGVTARHVRVRTQSEGDLT